MSGDDKDLRELAADLGDNLSRATGMSFIPATSANADGSGIYLKIENINPQTLKNQGYEITGNDHSITIRANQLNGLRNGVYNYLYMLGFRFYLPGDIWIHVPKLNTVFLNVNEQRYPVFENRAMFGTGGFPYHPVLDPQKTVQKKWEQWLQRTDWSSEEYIGGHMGEAFNKKYEAVLKSDTSLLARYNGRRTWSQSAKWCVSNARFVELFVKDRLEAYEAQRTKSPERHFISVEPADGGGYCQCENCAKIGTPSDQVFYLANQVAREIKKRWPDGGVSLYAYSDHAALPKDPVDDNVYVAVIPYAFQQIAVPEILLSEWRKKCTLMGIYDYWNLTDGSKDLPKLNYLLYVPQKIGLWTQLGIKGYTLESGYSKFGSGLFLYFLSRMAWDRNANINQLLGEFCSTNFGPAGDIMRSMFTRWSENFDAHQEVGRALDDIKKSRQLTSDPQILSRLKEVEDYIYYTAYYTDAVDHFDSENAFQKIENCIRYIWSVYDECLLNTSRIHQYFLLRPVRDKQKDLVNKWSLTNIAAQKDLWTSVADSKTRPINHQQLLDADFFAIHQTADPSQRSIASVDSRLQSLNFSFTSQDILKFTCGKTIYFSFNSGNDNSFSFKVKLPQATGDGAIPGAAIYDADKRFLKYILVNNQPGVVQDLKFDGLTKNTRYYILVNIPGITCEVQIPNKAIVIDASNSNNKFISLQTKQKVYLLVNPDATSTDLDARAFKGKVYSENNAPLSNVKNDRSNSVNTSGMKYLIVEPKGSNTLALTANSRESLYFFK